MKFVDRLKQSFIGISTATITLGGAVSGFRTVAQAIADGDAAIGDEIPMGVREGATWELSLFKVDSPTQLSRVRVLASWSGGTAATFPAGTHEIACTQPAEYLNGQDIAAVPALTTVPDTFRFIGFTDAGELRTIAAAVVKAYAGGTTSPADTTKPSAPTNLGSTSVTQTSYTVTFTPGADNVALARTEWSLNGSTWNTVSGGAAGNTFSVSGRTAGSTDNVQIRSVDTSGNTSSVITLPVVLQPASGNQAPALSGSISKSGITSSGFTFSWTAPTDVDGNGDRVETSIDGGASWMQHAFTATSRTVSGVAAATPFSLRVRAIDAAGVISNVLADTVTTSAAAATKPAAPTIGSAVAGDGYIDVAFTLNGNGGSAITSVTATLSTGESATGTTSPIRVTATNGTARTATVTAANNVGTSDPSAASNSVMPAAAVVYSVTPYSGNTLAASVDGSTPSSTQGSLKGFSYSKYANSQYWNISPAPASARSGWGTSNTVPPAEISAALNTGSSAINGMTPMSKGSGNAWTNTSVYLWVPVGSGSTGPYYYWVKPVDGAAVCMNAATGTMVNGA